MDHGNACLADPDLVEALARGRVPLTVCPLSNVRLKVVRDMAEHPLQAMLDAGLNVTINSDDPPYFGGYVTENLLACYRDLGVTVADIVGLVRNGIEAAFLTRERRVELLSRLQRYLDGRNMADNHMS
nr:hypothetical protein [Sphingomonas morindae]